MIKERILCTNLCCFQSSDKEPVMLYLKDLIETIRGSRVILREPKEPLFLYTVMIDPLCAGRMDIIVAGEIELYIYDAIRRGIERRNKLF